MKVKVKAVIFDFGHVLTLPPRPENMIWLSQQCGLSREQFMRGWREMRLEVDRGTLPVPEFWARMAERGGRVLSPVELRAMQERDLAAWTQPSPAMFAWAEELRRGGWATAILSNMPPVFLPYLEEHFAEVSLFSPTVFSGQVGMVKPEPGIYLRCLELLGLPAFETLFLDDLAVNVEAARSLGIHALEFHSAEVSGARVAEQFELPAIEPLKVRG